MGFFAAFGSALRLLLRRPIRSFLLLQGTVWGVAVALFPSAVIEGTRHAAMTRGATLGIDRIAIAADPTAIGSRPLSQDDVEGLLLDLEARRIPVHAAGAARVAAVFEGKGGSGALVEGDAALPLARGLDLAGGRWLEPGDSPRACVVEARVGRRLVGHDLAPGDEIRIRTRPGEEEEVFHVVGVTKPQDEKRLHTNDLGFDTTHPMYEEVTSRLLLMFGIPRVEDSWKRTDAVVYTLPRGEEVDWILLRTRVSDVKEASRVVSDALAARGCTPVVLCPLVLPTMMGHEIDRFKAVRTALFLACLVMGAVVMANLGLLTALTRTREIAVRRVEGATRGRIVGQFLLEGLTLTAVGCVVGCALGMALAALRVALAPVTGFAWVFPWHDALIVVAVALLIGGLAAWWPAWRAGRLEPIEGLTEKTK